MSKKGRCPHCEKQIGLQQAIFANGNPALARGTLHLHPLLGRYRCERDFVETLMPIANDLLQNSFGKPLDEAEQEHQWIPHVVRKLNV